MKKIIWILIFCLASNALFSQFYIRGEVRDERGRLLEGAKITLSSTGAFPYYTGSGGTFGISTSIITDTITLSLEGFEVFRATIDTRKFHSFLLKMLPTTAHLYNRKLSSLTTNLKAESSILFSVMGESYSNLIENN